MSKFKKTKEAAIETEGTELKEQGVEVSKPAPAKPAGHMFTYVGKGEGSPHVITLMGKQRFVRGQLTEVTDPELLAKLPGLQTFVEGPADMELLHEMDSKAKEEADKKRAEDIIVNTKFSKKHRVE
jgi:hypothetical protein